MTAIYVALVIYMVVLFGVGLFYSKKNATINDFLLAGRDLGVVAATLTVTASLFGGGLLTGSAQYAYDSGPMMYVYGIVGSGGGLLLAALLVHKMKDFSNYGTITQYLEARYGSRFLRTGSAILSMIALISIVGSQVAAVVGIMNALGMKNTTLAAVLAMGDVGGFAGLNSSLAAMTNELPTDYNVFMTPAHFKTLLWMILPGFMYVMIGQDIYQRLFACKSHKVALQTSVCSAILIMFIAATPVICGLIARVMHPELAAQGNSAAAYAILAMSVLPNWAVGIIIAASLSAILSTADSCLSAASSHFMTDFYLLYFAKDADPNDKRLVVVSQIFTVVAGAAAVVVSMTIPSILDACFNAYYIFTAGVFCPIVFGVFWKKTTKQGAIAGLVAGGVFVMFALSTGFNIAGIGGELLSGSAIMDESRSLRVQDSMNTRIIPHVHGIAKRMAGQTYDALMEELYAVFDNPIFLPDGTALMGSNWDATAIELYCDSLAIAVMDVAKLTEVHMERLVDPHLSGLPAFLVKNPGLNNGFMIPQYVTAGLLGDIALLCAPAAAFNAAVSAGQESPVYRDDTAARQLYQAVQKLRSLVSMTMLTALQAIDLSDHKAMSPVTQKIHDHARQTVTFMENDDLMYQRIEAMEHLVESNQLLADCSVPFTI